MSLPAWNPEPREKDQWRLLTKLRAEAQNVSNPSGHAHSALLHHDEHGH
jgi:hypothetical protein